MKVLNRQISWNAGEITWEADPRHIEILSTQLGLTDAKTVKTPGDKNDSDKMFRYRDLDEENAESSKQDAESVDAVVMTGVPCLLKKGRCVKCDRRGGLAKGACWACITSDEEDEPATSPGRCLPSLLRRKEDPKLVGPEFRADTEKQRRADLAADGWKQGQVMARGVCRC